MDSDDSRDCTRDRGKERKVERNTSLMSVDLDLLVI